jgi:TIR domain-containing protein
VDRRHGGRYYTVERDDGESAPGLSSTSQLMNAGGNSFDVFFSYHWRDHAPVEVVARTLTERGFRVFLDRWYLTPGQPWPQALERTLASGNSVVVFLGADGLGPWQQRERDLALDRQGREPGFPVIPVLLTRADPALGFLKLNNWVDLSANVADQPALEILGAAIRRQPPGPPVCNRSPPSERKYAPTVACGRSARRMPRSSAAARRSPRSSSRRSSAPPWWRSSAPPAAASHRWCAPG